MASRVNTGFVVGLSAALLCIMGVVAFFAYQSMSKSGDDAMASGDQAMAAGDATKAAGFYARAVNKDQRNPEYIKKWVGALEKLTPTPRQVYEDTFGGQYMLALRAMCDADRKNPEPFRKYFDQRYEIIQKSTRGLQPWERFGVEYEDMMKKYAGDEKGRSALRRYRGLARFGVLANNPDANQEIVDGGLEDFDAALSVDPNDGEAMINAAAMEKVKAARARTRGDTVAAEQLDRSSRQRLEAFAKTDGKYAPRASLEILRQKIGEQTRDVKDPAGVMEVMRASKDEITAIISKMKAAPPEGTDTATAVLVATFAFFALPDGGAVATDLLEHVKKGHPNDALFMLAWAGTDLTRGANDKAIELAKEVAAMPDRPLSVDGVLLFDYRARAIKLQTDAVFAAWDRSKDPAEREQLVKSMKALREDLAAKVGDAASPVLATDARLALISGDAGGARTLVTRYNEQTQQSDAQMLMLEGNLLLRTGNKGAAKQRFERALAIERANPTAAIALAELEVAASNYKDAARYYAMASQLIPSNEQLKQKVIEMSTLAQGGDIKDPVLKCLKQAQDQTFGVGADLNAAAATLRECLRQNPGDVRVSLGLARVLAALQNRDEALQVVNAALIKHPEDRTLGQYKKALEVQDPYVYAMETIDKTPNLSEAQKEMLKYDICRRISPPRLEEARQHLDKAVALAPEDPDVVEMLFTDAANNLNMPEVERLATLAEQRNLDRVNGLLYRGRKELAQALKYAQDKNAQDQSTQLKVDQKLSDAVSSLRSAVEKDKLCLPAWRMLGMIYNEQAARATDSTVAAARLSSAVDALAKAVEIKPDDLASINMYIQALSSLDRRSDALNFARKSEASASGDPTFVNMLLVLEQSAPGGSVERAIGLRQRMVEKIDPKSEAGISNKQQLCSLEINADRLTDAKKIIDELMALNPEDPVTNEIYAGWLGKSGHVKEAVKHYQDFLARLPDDKRTAQLYINANRLLLQLGQPDEAIKMLDQGRKYQDPKVMSVDREIGDVNFGLSRFEAADAAYRRVIDSGADDPGMSIQKRILECLLLQKKTAEFDAYIAKIPQAKQDATILLLAAEAAAKANDSDKARRLYDQVISMNPKGEVGYIKRADFNWNDPKMAKDVEADLEQVLRINPNSLLARIKLALWFRAKGRDDLAIQQLKLAVASDPFNEQVRLALIQTYNELGRYADAAAALEEAVVQTQGSLQWRMRAATGNARIGKFDRAAEHMASIWRERKGVEIAGIYTDYLLRSGTPTDINSAVNVLAAPEVASDKSLEMRMIRARLMAKRGQTLDAATEVAAIMAAIDPNQRDEVGGFMAGLTAMYPRTPDQIGALAKLEPRSKFQGFLALQAATIRLRSEETKAQAIAALQSIADTAQDSRLKAAAWAALGTLSYEQKDWNKAKEQFQKGLDNDTDNAEINNNMGYVLGVKLGEGAKGLPYAEKAVAAAPANAGFRDTLGAVYLAMNDYPKAAAQLSQALNQSLNDAERVPVYIHLGQARLGQGDKIEARRAAAQARELLAANDTLRASFEDDLKDLERKLDGQK